MPFVEKIAEITLYTNPNPAVRSRQAAFPGVARLPGGDLVALFVVGEAFEAANCRTYVSRSTDNGQTWNFEGPLYDQDSMGLGYQLSDCYKPTLLPDGTLAAIGYGFVRRDPEQRIADSETGEILPGYNVVVFSEDEGKTWSLPERVDIESEAALELSGPCLLTDSGTLLAAGPPFHMEKTGHYGQLLASTDGGHTWEKRSRYCESSTGDIPPWETRLCRGPSGEVIALWWAFRTSDETHLPNRIAISHDEGLSWSEPIDTGVTAQASNMIHLDGNRYMSIHCHRADATPGLWVRLVDLSGDRWKTLDEVCIWGGATAQDTSESMARQFAALQFGQPSLVRLSDEELLAVHWCAENGQYRIQSHQLRLK